MKLVTNQEFINMIILRDPYQLYYRQHDDDHFNLPCQFKCPLTPLGPNIFWKKPNRKNLDHQLYASLSGFFRPTTERVMGLEPTTATLATWRSTTELHPHHCQSGIIQHDNINFLYKHFQQGFKIFRLIYQEIHLPITCLIRRK